MNTLPAIGSRVRYVDPDGARTPVIGIVVKQYPSDGLLNTNEETGEKWVSSHAVAVKVDELPAWWPYPGTDRFAPSIDTLETA